MSDTGGTQRFTAVVFGAGDHHTPTEQRPQPPRLHEGDGLTFGPLRATIVALHRHPRLIELQFEHSVAQVWEGLARHGRPIQYAYVPESLAVWDTWTCIASRPVAFEAPSAGFVLDWAMLRAFRSRGVRFATITHAAGISSTGDAELDRALPFDEPYEIPVSTAMAITDTTRRGGRVVAIGTTVVRALEDAVVDDGQVAAGAGRAAQRVGPDTDLRVADAIISGRHESGSSHYELWRAFQQDHMLESMTREAEAAGYRAHEFGDALLISRARVPRVLSISRMPAVGVNGS